MSLLAKSCFAYIPFAQNLKRTKELNIRKANVKLEVYIFVRVGVVFFALLDNV